jgi:hypothetical protein
MMNKVKTRVLILMVLAGNAHAQIGWTLDQCRKHWGRESSIERTTTSTTCIFVSKIEKEVTLDQQGKVNDISYFEQEEEDGLLKIPVLLAMEEGVIWETDTDENEAHTSRNKFWLGKKDGVVVFHARYFLGHNEEGKWHESLEVLPIERSFYPPPISKIDRDWATANAARIEAEQKAKAATGPTKEELESAAHDAEMRANNERALKELNHE